MYPECRHVKPSGEGCHAAALSNSHWCYFHSRMYARQARQAERDARVVASRNLARRRHRLPDGTFTSDPVPSPSLVDKGANRPTIGTEIGEVITETLDYGAYPVATATREDVPFDLPPLEDAASIQLGLIEVAQALAANRIEPKRAGLLLYTLQVASTNAKHVRIPCSGIRSVTYTKEGHPLGPQEYGMDIEDYEEEECEYEECDACRNEDEV